MLINLLNKVEYLYQKKLFVILFLYLIFITILSLVFSTFIEIKFQK